MFHDIQLWIAWRFSRGQQLIGSSPIRLEPLQAALQNATEDADLCCLGLLENDRFVADAYFVFPSQTATVLVIELSNQIQTLDLQNPHEISLPVYLKLQNKYIEIVDNYFL